jgi:hypothetical protein
VNPITLLSIQKPHHCITDARVRGSYNLLDELALQVVTLGLAIPARYHRSVYTCNYS